MNTQLAQEIEKSTDGEWYIKWDWFPLPLPSNLELGDNVYLDTTYSFARFYSERPKAMKMGYASGNYLHSHFQTGRFAEIEIGKYVILEATNIIACKKITIGDHCMFSWGSFITDSWLKKSNWSIDSRRKMLEQLAGSEERILSMPDPDPVEIGINVWVGFDAVILPGVKLGRGCVVACKTIITEDVPAYAVVAGNPAKIIKYLEPDDVR